MQEGQREEDNYLYSLVFEGLRNNSPSTLAKVKGVFETDLEMTLAEVHKILSNVPSTIKSAMSERELARPFASLSAAGAKVLIVQNKAALQSGFSLADSRTTSGSMPQPSEGKQLKVPRPDEPMFQLDKAATAGATPATPATPSGAKTQAVSTMQFSLSEATSKASDTTAAPATSGTESTQAMVLDKRKHAMSGSFNLSLDQETPLATDTPATSQSPSSTHTITAPPAADGVIDDNPPLASMRTSARAPKKTESADVEIPADENQEKENPVEAAPKKKKKSKKSTGKPSIADLAQEMLEDDRFPDSPDGEEIFDPSELTTNLSLEDTGPEEEITGPQSVSRSNKYRLEIVIPILLGAAILGGINWYFSGSTADIEQLESDQPYTPARNLDKRTEKQIAAKITAPLSILKQLNINHSAQEYELTAKFIFVGEVLRDVAIIVTFHPQPRPASLDIPPNILKVDIAGTTNSSMLDKIDFSSNAKVYIEDRNRRVRITAPFSMLGGYDPATEKLNVKLTINRGYENGSEPQMNTIERLPENHYRMFISLDIENSPDEKLVAQAPGEH